jgi:hypothetical protein
MGDQITRGMRLSHFSTTYYLMLDDNGKPAGLPTSASPSIFRQCTPLFDTVQIAVPSLKLYSGYPSSGKRTAIKKGESVIRVFHFRGSTYCYRPGSSPLYGWSTLRTGTYRKSPVQKQPEKSAYVHLHARIMKRLESTNRRYDSLFCYFNTVTSQQKSVPFWEYSEKNGIHHYTLNGSRETVMQLAGSTRYIVGDIEAILLGKPFSVAFKDGIITIGPR